MSDLVEYKYKLAHKMMELVNDIQLQERWVAKGWYKGNNWEGKHSVETGQKFREENKCSTQ